jgi:hypothetical protein
MGRILVEQVAQVGGWALRSSDREQHCGIIRRLESKSPRAHFGQVPVRIEMLLDQVTYIKYDVIYGVSFPISK